MILKILVKYRLLTMDFNKRLTDLIFSALIVGRVNNEPEETLERIVNLLSISSNASLRDSLNCCLT